MYRAYKEFSLPDLYMGNNNLSRKDNCEEATSRRQYRQYVSLSVVDALREEHNSDDWFSRMLTISIAHSLQRELGWAVSDRFTFEVKPMLSYTAVMRLHRARSDARHCLRPMRDGRGGTAFVLRVSSAKLCNLMPLVPSRRLEFRIREKALILQLPQWR